MSTDNFRIYKVANGWVVDRRGEASAGWDSVYIASSQDELVEVVRRVTSGRLQELMIEDD